LRSIKKLRILPRAAEAIKKLNKLGFLIVVVTNQPVVARGWLKEKEVDALHALLVRRVAKKGAKIDAVYFCPHHPNANLKRYRMQCACRKPNIDMISKAIKKYKINKRDSWMIGDSTRDILAGKRAKLKTILVKTGYAGRDGKYKVKPDFVAKDLHTAVKIIKKFTT